MTTPSKSSPESPAKEQPGEQNAELILALRVIQAGEEPYNNMPAEVRETCGQAAAMIEKLGQGWIPARPDLVHITRAFLQSIECPECDGSGWHTNTGPDPQHDPCQWCEARARFLAGEVPLPPPSERP